MSYDHMRGLCEKFQGSTVERLVLLIYAMHADPTTGIARPSILTVAALSGIDPSNVRRIVRKYEGSTDGTPVAGAWLYPQGGIAKPGQLNVTPYRMAKNPPGIQPRQKRPQRLKKSPETGRVPNPTRSGSQPDLNHETGRVPNPTRSGSQPDGVGLATLFRSGSQPDESLESHSKPGSQTDQDTDGPEVRQSPATPTPLDDWIQSGASPQTPKQPAEEGNPIDEPHQTPALPDAELSDHHEVALITDHQPAGVRL